MKPAINVLFPWLGMATEGQRGRWRCVPYTKSLAQTYCSIPQSHLRTSLLGCFEFRTSNNEFISWPQIWGYETRSARSHHFKVSYTVLYHDDNQKTSENITRSRGLVPWVLLVRDVHAETRLLGRQPSGVRWPGWPVAWPVAPRVSPTVGTNGTWKLETTQPFIAVPKKIHATFQQTCYDQLWLLTFLVTLLVPQAVALPGSSTRSSAISMSRCPKCCASSKKVKNLGTVGTFLSPKIAGIFGCSSHQSRVMY